MLDRDEHELLARIAHGSYIQARTQAEIAEALSLSRPKVQRLLERARNADVVDIGIDVPSGLDLDLGAELAGTFDLADFIVSAEYADDEEQRRAVGASAARYGETTEVLANRELADPGELVTRADLRRCLD